MPRPLRIHAPGILYHIICRGNQRQNVFLDDQDFRAYLHRIEEIHPLLPFRLYAYALMRNHLHLLVEVGSVPISRIMQTLQQRYTQYFNAKHKKIGHIFHGRFKSIICQRDEYLLELVRYIHLNPVRAKVAAGPGDYPWTSHKTYLAAKAPLWLDRDAILRQFSKNRDQAKRRYEDFIRRGMGEGHRDDLYALKEQQVLGDDDFLGTLPLGNSGREPSPTSASIDQIVAAVASAMDTEKAALLRKGKDRTLYLGRGLIALLAAERGHRIKDVAAFFRRSGASICQSVSMVKQKLLADRRLSELKTNIENQLQR